MIPFVGDIVGLYEAISGKDLFGYDLTDEERVILAFMSLIPTLGRFTFKGSALGRYSPRHAVQLARGTESSWLRATQVTGQALMHTKEVNIIKEAAELVIARSALLT
jgi:hypothetical protein